MLLTEVVYLDKLIILKMEKMFNEEEKEESKENDGGSEVFPIFRYCKVVSEPRLNRLKCPFSR